ncbi:RNA12 protein-domain-containing protein [Paraphysoderma sedebokerense]|nr:RNA12 protein-domain-containing protein [Paraphysoderma sedebokerense]
MNCIRYSILHQTAGLKSTRALRPNPYFRRLTTSTATINSAACDLPSHLHPTPTTANSVTLYLNNVFPISSFRFDPRRLLQYFISKEQTIKLIKSRYIASEFEVVDVIPRWKEGGALVTLKTSGKAEKVVLESVRNHLLKRGREVFNLSQGKAWIVQGRPFIEDILALRPSRYVKVEFQGPDVTFEKLYTLFRPYGPIVEIKPPSPSSKDLPRSALIQFTKLRSATTARNCLYGFAIDSTVLRIGYEPVLKTRFLFDWLTAHPRFTLPFVAGLLLTLTYTIFDPIRIQFISFKLYPFHFQQTTAMKYLSSLFQKVYEYFPSLSQLKDKYRIGFGIGERKSIRDTEVEINELDGMEGVKEKLIIELMDKPENFIVVVGPKGSGKDKLVEEITRDIPYKLNIDCSEIVTKSNTDNDVLNILAKQVGYYPVFSFLAWLSNMLDKIVGVTIGGSAGISVTVDTQIKKVLECVGIALSKSSKSQPSNSSSSSINSSTSPANISPESLPSADKSPDTPILPVVIISDFLRDKPTTGAGFKGLAQFYESLAEWAGWLVENGIANVVFVTGGERSGGELGVRKVLGKVSQTRPLEIVTLSDMSPASAFTYLQKRLSQYALDIEPAVLNKVVEKVGGRVADLEAFVQKVRSGMKPQESLDDLISKSVTELTKYGFGEDYDSANKKLPWSKTQFWWIVKEISSGKPVRYDDVLSSPLFKNDETILKAMEQSALIQFAYNYSSSPHSSSSPTHSTSPLSISSYFSSSSSTFESAHEDREAPSKTTRSSTTPLPTQIFVHPSKQLYRTAISYITANPYLSKSLDLMLYKELIGIENAKLASYEDEIGRVLKPWKGLGVGGNVMGKVPDEVKERVDRLVKLVGESNRKIEKWEDEMNRVKKRA